MSKLNILWTTTNRDTISNMMVMYASNAILKNWWEDVNIIIWGGSTKLIGENKEVQEEVRQMIKAGVHIEACQACAEKYGAVNTLKSLGVDVKYMGQPLTAYLKADEKILTM